jgi:hypothetical protein
LLSETSFGQFPPKFVEFQKSGAIQLTFILRVR